MIVEGSSITVFTKEPRENGRANADVIRQVSDHFHVDHKNIRIVRGAHRSQKILKIDGQEP